MIALPVILPLLLILTPLTTSHPPPWHPNPAPCLSDADAALLANVYASFSVSFDPAYAGQFLADDFTLQADSFNILTNGLLPLGSLTAPNKTAFIAGALALTTSTKQSPVTIENIIHSCDEIALRYVTADVPPIQGIDILYAGLQGGQWVLHKAYAEFDVLADLVGRGLWPCRCPEQAEGKSDFKSERQALCSDATPDLIFQHSTALLPLHHPCNEMILRCSFRPGSVLSCPSYSTSKTYRAYSASASQRQFANERLRILFCGSEEFSAYSLKALSEYADDPQSNIESIDVVTRTDKHVGRGLKRLNSPILKTVAETLHLPVHQIDTFTGWTPPSYDRDGKHPARINLIIAVSFGLLVPPRILRGAAHGGLNVHPSLLPQFKGAAPIQWTILNGLKTTAVSVQTLHESKFDEGVVLDRTLVSIENPQTCTFSQLRDQLSSVGADLLVKAVREKKYLSQNAIQALAGSEHTSYAPKLRKQHAAIDPQIHGSQQIIRMLRVFGNIWAYAEDLNGNSTRIVASSITAHGLLGTESHLTIVPNHLQSTANSMPIGVPYGICRSDQQPRSAGQTPLFMNTLDGLVAINQLTVSGLENGYALECAAKGKLLEHHARVEDSSGEAWDIYKFRKALRGETNGLPTIAPESV